MSGAESALGGLASARRRRRAGGRRGHRVRLLRDAVHAVLPAARRSRDAATARDRSDPAEGQRRDALLTLVGNTTRAVVYGTGLTALLQGALVGIGFAIADVPSPSCSACWPRCSRCCLPAARRSCGCRRAVAVRDRRVGLWRCSCWSGARSSPSPTTSIRPMLIRSHAEVSTLAVFVGVVGGVAAFGTIGIIVGPVLLTLIVSLLRLRRCGAGAGQSHDAAARRARRRRAPRATRRRPAASGWRRRPPTRRRTPADAR